MSAEPPGRVPTGEPAAQPAGDHAATGTRARSVFALPAGTGFRFALLIAAVVMSSSMIYEAIYTATPRGAVLQTVIRVCMVRALAPHLHGLIAYAGALGRSRACRAGAERVAGWWVLLGIGVLAVVAGAIYWAQPSWYRLRKHLVPLTREGITGVPALLDHLEQLRERAGTGPVVWLMQPRNHQLSAFAFGHLRRRFVAVSGGAVAAQGRKPAEFDAVVLHELAHIKNADIDQTYLAIAIWRAFVITALLPMVWLFIFYWGPRTSWQLLWRVAVLGLIVYLLRDSILRAREYYADARVQELDPDTRLGAVLAALPPPRGRRKWHLGWMHPSSQDRAKALLDPAPLYRSGFWDGLAVGVVAAMGAEAGQELIYLLVTTNPSGGLIPAAVFALFSGTALAIIMWRMRLLHDGKATAQGWAVGLGLGIGLAIGPVITLTTALDQGVAPDSLRPGSLTVLVIWIALVGFLFASVPVWIGYWADAWQQRAGTTQPRVPARGGMLFAAIGACIVLAIGLTLLLAYFTFVEDFTATTKIVLTQTWTFSGLDAAAVAGVWVVPLLFIAIPLTGFLFGIGWQPAGDTAPKPRTWLKRSWPVTLICLAGAVTVIAVTLVTAAVAHAHIALAVRWNQLYYGQFPIFEGQMVILVAVVFALIAAAKLTSVQSPTIAIAVGAIIAVLGVLAQMGAWTIGNCVAPLNYIYNSPPASVCPGNPGHVFGSQIFPAALEAALIAILLIPAARYAGSLIARPDRPRPGARALTWLTAGVVAVAVIAGIAFRVPDASAHGIQPIGSVGQDGWVYGNGYQIRQALNWYHVTRNIRPGYAQLEFDGSFSGTPAWLIVRTVPVRPSAVLQVAGSRPALLDGEKAVTDFLPDYRGYSYKEWFAIRETNEYIVVFQTRPGDYALFGPGLTAMISTWRWNATSS